MNVTVIIPKPLQAACEGRARIELGVPGGADVGDVLQTLIALYPGLRAFVASDKRPLKHYFSVAPAPGKLYLFSTHG